MRILAFMLAAGAIAWESMMTRFERNRGLTSDGSGRTPHRGRLRK